MRKSNPGTLPIGRNDPSLLRGRFDFHDLNGNLRTFGCESRIPRWTASDYSPIRQSRAAQKLSSMRVSAFGTTRPYRSAPRAINTARLSIENGPIDGGKGGSGAQFINHSCSPNLEPRVIQNRIFFFSRRNIRSGEELTFSYRYPSQVRHIPCRRGAARCRGFVRLVLVP